MRNTWLILWITVLCHNFYNNHLADSLLLAHHRILSYDRKYSKLGRSLYGRSSLQIESPRPYFIDTLHSLQMDEEEVTPANVAVRSGIGLRAAEKELLRLASLLSSEIHVSSTGELIFKFPLHIWQQLQRKYIILRLRHLGGRCLAMLVYTFKAMCGILLITSLSVLAATSLAFNSNLHQSGPYKKRNSRRDDTVIPVHEVIRLIADLLRYGASFRDNTDDSSGLFSSFLQACYSLLFGDGNPNESNIDLRCLLMSK